MSKFSYKVVTGDVELQEAFDVRRQVFVREQGISEDLVFDGHDREALHMVVKVGEKVIGSARVQFLAGNPMWVVAFHLGLCIRKRLTQYSKRSFIKFGRVYEGSNHEHFGSHYTGLNLFFAGSSSR